MKFCFWHKWQYLKQEEKGTFMGEPYTWKWRRFRVCLKCGTCQEINSHSQGFSWHTLCKGKTSILAKKYGIEFKSPRQDRPAEG